MLLREEAKTEQRKYISMIYIIAIIENSIHLFQRHQQIHQRNQQQIPRIEDDQKIRLKPVSLLLVVTNL